MSEGDGYCVSVFNPSDEKLRSLGTHGSGQNQFKNPCGVAVDTMENIFVTIFAFIYSTGQVSHSSGDSRTWAS